MHTVDYIVVGFLIACMFLAAAKVLARRSSHNHKAGLFDRPGRLVPRQSFALIGAIWVCVAPRFSLMKPPTNPDDVRRRYPASCAVTVTQFAGNVRHRENADDPSSRLSRPRLEPR